MGTDVSTPIVLHKFDFLRVHGIANTFGLLQSQSSYLLQHGTETSKTECKIILHIGLIIYKYMD